MGFVDMSTTAQFEFWNRLLALPDFRVTHVTDHSHAQQLVITVAPQHDLGLCPHCQRASDTVKQRRTRDGIYDLPLGPHRVALIVRVNQYECDHCSQAFTPPIPFLAEGAQATERFVTHAASLIRISDVANTARMLGVPERTLEAWYLAWVERQHSTSPAPPLKPIRHIGIDEISLKKSSGSSSR
jgi:transposase